MQLQCYPATFSMIRTFGTALRCAECGDQLIAPVASEFVDGGEIRHYWECESCGTTSCTSIDIETSVHEEPVA
ncbi:MAG: hypothetical protein JSR72_15175 [Proteobacteria bacterium]|nr:hypothetical protein [Pseudomonadota bacterium]